MSDPVVFVSTKQASFMAGICANRSMDNIGVHSYFFVLLSNLSRNFVLRYAVVVFRYMRSFRTCQLIKGISKGGQSCVVSFFRRYSWSILIAIL